MTWWCVEGEKEGGGAERSLQKLRNKAETTEQNQKK